MLARPLALVQMGHLRCERDILRGLDHPLIVRLKGSCQDEDCVYFFMEYVPGGLVSNLLRSLLKDFI